MVRFFGIVIIVIFCKHSAQESADLIPEAITVYRNPEFFKNLNYDSKTNYNQKSEEVSEEAQGDYKYPGETKKSNPQPPSPGFEINYDNSPEFHHEPRDIFVDTARKPKKKKGPYSPRYSKKHDSKADIQKPVHEAESEEDDSKESKENLESVEEPRDFVSVFNENPDEEFGYYHEPILLAKPNFDVAGSSGFTSGTHTKQQQYNRTRPILYEEWKRQTYPKIYADEHLKSHPKLYSEEPSSNFFEDESSSYYKNDDEAEDTSNFFETDEFRNLGADTKHIYKKLLRPKKSFMFTFHSKPKFRKLKLKLKKQHLHNTDWFDEYPFDF